MSSGARCGGADCVPEQVSLVKTGCSQTGETVQDHEGRTATPAVDSIRQLKNVFMVQAGRSPADYISQKNKNNHHLNILQVSNQ